MPDGVSSSPDPAVCSHTASQSAQESSAFRQSQDTALDTPNGVMTESLLLAYSATLNTARNRGYRLRYACRYAALPVLLATAPLRGDSGTCPAVCRQYAQALFLCYDINVSPVGGDLEGDNQRRDQICAHIHKP